MRVDHHSFLYLFAFFYLNFIPPFHSTSFDFIIFSSCLMFDMGLASTLYSCLFDCDNSFIVTFCVGTPRFGTHDVFYALHFMHEGYGDYIIGVFEPSFLSFLSPYYLGLRYVLCLKTTLRPLLHIVFDSSQVGNTRAWSEIISWSMTDEELRWWFTLGHTPLISDEFSDVTLSTLGHTPLIDDVFFRDDALHWGIVSSLLHLDYDGLGVVGRPYTRA